MLEGPAGAGKTALIAAAVQDGEGPGLRVIGARGGELERDYPFGVIRQLYQPFLASVDSGTAGPAPGRGRGAAAWVLV